MKGSLWLVYEPILEVTEHVLGRLFFKQELFGSSSGGVSRSGSACGLLDIGSYGLEPGPVGRCALLFVAPAPDDLGTAGFSECRQLLDGAGLADAGRAHEHHQAAVAGEGIIQGGFKLGHLLNATHEDAAYVSR